MSKERPSSRARWAFSYLALIHFASSTSLGEGVLPIPAGLDKLIHLCEFGILALLFWRPIRNTAAGHLKMRAALILFVFVAVNGLVDELHQSFVPGREPSLIDAAADLLGGGLAILWLLHRERARILYANSGPPRDRNDVQ
jgi:VanZ family protein